MTDYSTDEFILFGALANASYDETLQVGQTLQLNGAATGYQLMSQWYPTDSTSFGGQAYYSASDNRLVISFQGSSQVGDYVLTDFFVGAGGSFTNQYSNSQIFTSQALAVVAGKNAEIVFVGHSLGGYLAQQNVLSDPSYNAVVFNAPGLGGLSPFPLLISDPNVTYIYSESWGASGVIHGLGQRLSDNVYYVPNTDGHGLGNLLLGLSNGRHLTLLSDAPTFTDAINNGWISIEEAVVALNSIGDNYVRQQIEFALQHAQNNCFLSGTFITLGDGTLKKIESIVAGDQVLAFDSLGKLVPSVVKRTFQKQAKHILDVFGLMVTPGHITLCGDGNFAGKYVPILDILRSDGALVRQDGSLVRASTGVAVGDVNDRHIWAVTGDKTFEGFHVVEAKKIRLGTRFLLNGDKDYSIAEIIEANGGEVTDDGLVKTGDAVPVPFHWSVSPSIPNPEDYVLQRSCLTLTDIYQVAEWDGAAPFLATPVMSDIGPVAPVTGKHLEAIRPNFPLALRREHRTGEIGSRNFVAVTSNKHKRGH